MGDVDEHLLDEDGLKLRNIRELLEDVHPLTINLREERERENADDNSLF